ncbi:MAG: hypothetical protein GXO28_04715 [Methanopyri archaeon]|nr:hypothetical protein [Methanopyri archaeon]
MRRGTVLAVLTVILGAVVACAASIHYPLLSRDSRAHAVKIWYTYEMLKHGRWDAWCPVWYCGFPYLTYYGSFGYIVGLLTYLVSGSPFTAFSLCLLVAATIFGLGIYAICRARGVNKRTAVVCSLLALCSGGVMKAINWSGVYPNMLSLSFGLLALAAFEGWLRGRMKRGLAHSTLLLVPAYYTHPLGGMLSGGLIFTRAAAECAVRWKEENPRSVLRLLLLSLVPVTVAGLIALPHYAAAAKYKRFLAELYLYPPGSVPDILKDVLLGGKWDPGLLVLLPGLAGALVLWRRKRDAWVPFLAFWGLVTAIVIFAYTLGYWRYLPFGRNMLAERFTLVLMPALLAVAAAPVVEDILSRISRSIKGKEPALVAVPVVLAIGAVGAFTYVPPAPPKITHSALECWHWIKHHYGGDLARRVSADPYTHLYDASVPVSPVLDHRPTIQGWFSQGDPMFFSLAARWEWELGWVYDPNFLHTSLWVADAKYFVTRSTLLTHKLLKDKGNFVYVKRFGKFRIFRFLHPGGEAAVIPRPIGVVDHNLGLKTENAYYTTLLNFVATPGNRHIFVDAGPKYAWDFPLVIVRPRTAADVDLAEKLAASGKKVLLIIPERGTHLTEVIKRTEEDFGVRLKRSNPPAFVPSKRYLKHAFKVDGRWWKDVHVGKGMVRVCGVDVVRFVMSFHHLIKSVQTTGYKMPRLPTHAERKFVNALLRGFSSGKPIPVHMTYRDPEKAVIDGKGWVLVKITYFPAWRSSSGPVHPASCGMMLIKSDGRTVLHYHLPWTVTYAPLAAAIVGIVALGGLYRWTPSRPS